MYRCLQRNRGENGAAKSCPDFRDVIPVMVRYYREHKHDKTKQIPIR
ncbi:Male sterility domain-containing protein [Parageobacillus genomosp. 1]|uniref:Male sterility domain-containing protein n=1 Tax=Parageobacillus genomosp. 1 TaxID=1295642 RepID=A0ABC9VG41_9BACL|nr:Male sterility domain-containing protein [Parageobacillus genomosp. 1]